MEDKEIYCIEYNWYVRDGAEYCTRAYIDFDHPRKSRYLVEQENPVISITRDDKADAYLIECKNGQLTKVYNINAVHYRKRI